MANKTKSIVQLSATSGRFIAKYDSLKEAEVATGIPTGNISRNLRGNAKTVMGFYFLYEEKWKAKRGII